MYLTFVFYIPENGHAVSETRVHCVYKLFFYHVATALVGQGLLIVEDS
jgi:hypothetical protein